MDTVILYYTLGGSSKREAEKLAEKTGGTLVEVKEAKKRGVFSAFLPGCPQALKRKASAIYPISEDLNAYRRVALCAPVWAGFPAPAFNAMVSLLPPGKEVEILLCSGGGETPKSAQGTREMVEAKGCHVAAYRDIKTEAPPSAKK